MVAKEEVVTVVNYIQTILLKFILFFPLCKDMRASLFDQVKELSHGKLLQCVYELRYKISILLKEKHGTKVMSFHDQLFVIKLSYVVNILHKL